MKGLELIQTYPAAGKVVKDWFFKSMLESFKDESVPDEFKEFMLEQGIEDDKIGILIDVNPRMLFDVFDDNNIKIHIAVGSDISADNFSFYIASDIKKTDGTQGASVKDIVNDFKTRKEAEIKSIEYAFELLEIKLSPKIEE